MRFVSECGGDAHCGKDPGQDVHKAERKRSRFQAQTSASNSSIVMSRTMRYHSNVEHDYAYIDWDRWLREGDIRTSRSRTQQSKGDKEHFLI